MKRDNTLDAWENGRQLFDNIRYEIEADYLTNFAYSPQGITSTMRALRNHLEQALYLNRESVDAYYLINGPEKYQGALRSPFSYDSEIKCVTFKRKRN